MTRLERLIRDREHACRLLPELALETLEEAHSFLHERGMLTLTPDGSLPSLFGAVHEEPYKAGSRGFGAYPKTKWWWGGALSRMDGVVFTKLHRGKTLFLSHAAAVLVDPLCRKELARADFGEHGDDARRLVGHLRDAGPSYVEELKEELGLDKRAFARARTTLERVGAVVSVSATPETASGRHTHTSELRRWDHVFAAPPSDTRGGLDELFAAAVRAAVVAPEAEARRWLSWTMPAEMIDDLVEAGVLARPAPGLLAAR